MAAQNVTGKMGGYVGAAGARNLPIRQSCFAGYTLRQPYSSARRRIPNAAANPKLAIPAKRRLLVPGSGTPLVGKKLVSVVVPSRFTFTVRAKPSVVLVVSTGIVPAVLENTLKAKVLPDVDTPSGELSAGPYRLTSKERVEPNVKPWK